MTGQPGFFDQDERLQALSAAGDPLERLAAVVDFEGFGSDLMAALSRSDRAKGWRAALSPGIDVQSAGFADAVHALRRPDRVSAEGPTVVHAVCRVGSARPRPGHQDDLALPRAVGASRRGRALVRTVRRGAAGQRLAGDGRTNRRCDGYRGASAAADPGREGHDQGRRGAVRVETGAARADRPRRTRYFHRLNQT